MSGGRGPHPHGGRGAEEDRRGDGARPQGRDPGRRRTEKPSLAPGRRRRGRGDRRVGHPRRHGALQGQAHDRRAGQRRDPQNPGGDRKCARRARRDRAGRRNGSRRFQPAEISGRCDLLSDRHRPHLHGRRSAQKSRRGPGPRDPGRNAGLGRRKKPVDRRRDRSRRCRDHRRRRLRGHRALRRQTPGPDLHQGGPARRPENH